MYIIYVCMYKQREVNGAISVGKRIGFCGKSIILKVRVCTICVESILYACADIERFMLLQLSRSNRILLYIRLFP